MNFHNTFGEISLMFFYDPGGDKDGELVGQIE